MNAFTYTHRAAARFVAILAVFSLLMTMMPMQTFAAAVDPTQQSGNPTCTSLGLTGFKIDPPANGSLNGITYSLSNNGKDLSWSANSSVIVNAVIVKGANSANIFTYNPPAMISDSGLQAPLNNGNQIPEISHFEFCFSPVIPDPSAKLTIVKAVEKANEEDTIPTPWTFEFAHPQGVGFSLTNGVSSKVLEGNILGAHTFTETQSVGDDWDLTSIACTGTITNSNVNLLDGELSVVLADGDDATCTFTNTYRPADVDPEMVTIKACKYNSETEQTIAGWEMTITNNGEGEDEVTFTGETGENGCFTATVDPEDGPFHVTEENRSGWTQDSVNATIDEAVLEGEDGIEYCVFNGDVDAECEFWNSEDDREEPSAPVCQVGNNLLKNGSFEDPIIDGDWSLSTVTDWMIAKVSDASSVLGEIWANGLLGGASDGDQHLELDSTEPTVVSQSVVTIPGATYELRFDYRSRPDTDAATNGVEAMVDGLAIASALGTQAEWTTYTETFVASSTSSDIAFKDVGTADALGTLLDNAVLCLVTEPEPLVVIEEDQSSSSSSSGTRTNRGRRGQVAGDSTSTTPAGQVLGDQVSVVPLGAANAGGGGAAPVAIPSIGLATMAFVGRTRNNA